MTLARRVVQKDRLVSMAEAADLLGVKPGTARVRAQKVRRMVRRLESRDGTTYMRRLGHKWHVSVSSLEELIPWDPTTLGQMRIDIDDLRHGLAAQNSRLNSHAAFIRKQRKFNKLVAATLKAAESF